MFQIIEHIDNPKICLQKAHNLLKKGGYLIIETPNIDSWDDKIFKKRYWAGWHAPRHWNIMKKKFLEDLIKKNGFKIVSSKCTANPYAWLHSFQYLLKFKFKKKKLADLFEVNNFFLLSIFTLIDLIQLKITKISSNTQILAQKI